MGSFRVSVGRAKGSEGELGGGDRWETASTGSAASGTSRASKLSAASCAASRAIVDAQRRLRGSASLSSAEPSPVAAEILQGDSCVTISEVTIRRGVDFNTEELATLPAGTAVDVLQVSSRRLRVAAAGVEGWISSHTRFLEPLVVKPRKYASCDGLQEVTVGSKYKVRSPIDVRLEEAPTSERKATLKPGIVVSVEQVSYADRYRTKISGPKINGWINLLSSDFTALVEETDEDPEKNSGAVVFTPKYIKIKQLLEAAVDGNAEELRRLIEQKNDWFSSSGRSSLRPSLNASDICGKTALMYTSGLGHRAAVEYLLSRPEININATDNTEKTALHHASKRPLAQRRTEDHSQIVHLLLGRRAALEARDHNDCTALMFAVANGDEAITFELLLAKANVNVQDTDGHTPLDYAVNFSRSVISDMLRCRGAWSPLDNISDADSDEIKQADSEEYEWAIYSPRQSTTIEDSAAQMDIGSVATVTAQNAEGYPVAGGLVGVPIAQMDTAAPSKAKKKKSSAKKASPKASGGHQEPADSCSAEKKNASKGKKKKAKAKGSSSKAVPKGMLEAVANDENQWTVVVAEEPLSDAGQKNCRKEEVPG